MVDNLVNSSYFFFCNHHSKEMDSRRILIIIDLNGPLVKTQPKGKYNIRPHLDHFIAQMTDMILRDVIQVAFWTSKPEEKARPIFEAILGNTLLKHALFVWYRDACTPIVIDNNPFHTKKDLTKVWGAFPQYNESNTYLLDDTPSKCGDFPANLIQAPPYLGPRKARQDDGFKIMLQLIKEKTDSCLSVSMSAVPIQGKERGDDELLPLEQGRKEDTLV